MKKWILLFVIPAFALLITGTPYAQYLSPWDIDPSERIYLDDQIFLTAERVYLEGFIYDSRFQNGIEDAVVAVSHDELLPSPLETETDETGHFQLDAIPSSLIPYRVEVRALGYASHQTAIEVNKSIPFIEIGLAKTNRVRFEAQETKVIEDPTHRARLKLSSDKVKRIDNKPVQYPIYVSLAYIDMNTNGSSMPGVNMLTEDPRTQQIRPMTSFGAVAIEAVDQEDIPLRLNQQPAMGDPSKALLEIVPSVSLQDNPIQERLAAWEFDPLSGDFTWQQTPANLDIPPNPFSEILANLPEAYLNRYFHDLLWRIQDQNPQEMLYGNFDGIEGYASNIRITSTARLAEVFFHLLTFILNDIELTGVIDTYANEDYEGGCAYLVYSLEPRFWTVLDAYFQGVWYPADTYGTGSTEEIWMTYPQSLTDGFDYTPLSELAQEICHILQLEYEKQQWREAVRITTFDLVPFNLDVPWNGVPVELQLEETEGDGRFKVVLETEGEQGKFHIQKVLYTTNEYATFKILFPSGNEARLSIFTEFGQTIPSIQRVYTIPESQILYKWADPRNKGEFVDEQNNPPVWVVLDTISF